MFCSAKCRAVVAWKGQEDMTMMLADAEPAVLARLFKEAYVAADCERTIIDRMHRDENRQTIFDFDFSKMNTEQKAERQLKCLFGLKTDKMLAESPFFAHYLMGVASLNAIGMSFTYVHCRKQNGEDAMTIGLFGALLNHSCDPNIHRVTLEDKIVFYVAKPIKSGEQLFICYK